MKPDSPIEKTIALLADTTVDPLFGLLENSNDRLKIRCLQVPYGQVYQILLDPNHPVWKANPNYVFIWTIPSLTISSFRKLLDFDAYSADEILAEVGAFADLVLKKAEQVELVLVASWTNPPYQRWIQTLTWKQNAGLANIIARANLLLSEKFGPHPNIILLDSSYWHSTCDGPIYDMRLYAIGKILYSYECFSKVAQELQAVIRGVLGFGKKVVICDLDNTLWGGVAVDDGIEAIKLGSPDPIGECYSNLQKSLKALKSRGIVLAICSKNDESFALSVIEQHPAMILKKGDFVTWRINWNEKADNILSIASELNLGLDAFVFLDDSPEERSQVQKMLPDVFVPQFPSEPDKFAAFLGSLSCFETASLSKEDFERTMMYQAERQRTLHREVSGNVEEWLHSLEIVVKVAPLSKDSLPRAAQLLNKTNQFNLSVRRMEEATFWEWAGLKDNRAYVFYLSDKFGDFGLIGIGSYACSSPNEVRIVDFVMSCRAMGKRVEDAMLSYIVQQALSQGAEKILAPPKRTERNAPVIDFFSGKYSDPASMSLDLKKTTSPSVVQIVEEKV
jgi:FkbH-like protein